MTNRKRVFDAMYKLGNIDMCVGHIVGTSGLSKEETEATLLELHNLGQINGRAIRDLKIPVKPKLKSMDLFPGLEVVRRPRGRAMRSSSE